MVKTIVGYAGFSLMGLGAILLVTSLLLGNPTIGGSEVSQGTSPDVEITTSGYVVDAPDIEGQEYITQEDGTVTIVQE